MEKLTLLWNGRSLGTVEVTGADQPWFHGKFAPSELDQLFVEFFNFMVDEDNVNKDPPFAADLLSDENWFLESETGKKIPITVPAIYLSEREISWRKR